MQKGLVERAGEGAAALGHLGRGRARSGWRGENEEDGEATVQEQEPAGDTTGVAAVGCRLGLVC